MQPSKSTKTQISEEKLKNALKKHLSGKKWDLFAYLRLCNRNIDLTKLVKVLSALYEQK